MYIRIVARGWSPIKIVSLKKYLLYTKGIYFNFKILLFGWNGEKRHVTPSSRSPTITRLPLKGTTKAKPFYIFFASNKQNFAIILS